MGTKGWSQGNDVAALEFRQGWYRIVFRYRGQKFQKSLETQAESKALQLQARLEENLELLRRGRLQFAGGDLVTFLLSDGRINEEPVVNTQTLGQLLDAYDAPWKEALTQTTEKIHVKHLRRILGARTPVLDLNLQEYINKRAKELYRGKPISNVTIQKELGTLSVIGVRQKGLKFPKQIEKEPFQTWKEIEKRIQKGGAESLWDCLFLMTPEIEEFIQFAKENARPFVHAMIVFAAHTGARRSEMMRSQKQDIDFESGLITIREKKKDTSKSVTYRKVPMTPILNQTLQEWFKIHGGCQTFGAEQDTPLSPQLASHHFRWLVDDSKWKVLKGWHVLRHSFITACVMKGIDQRMIDLWTGHTTDVMRKRYTHLIPSTAKVAIESVFV
jgi:integrase